MPRYYFQHADGSYSNVKKSAIEPTEVIEAGGQWVEGDPPENADVYVEKTISDKLDEVFLQQPIQVRAAFAEARVTVERHIQLGEFDVAREIINQKQVPPELEEAKQTLLDMFDAM